MKKEHKFVGVILYTGYVESNSVAGTVIGCAPGVFYKDPIKLLKNLAHCFSAAYITDHEYNKRYRPWIEDSDERYDNFLWYVDNILQGTYNDLGEFNDILEHPGSPFMWNNTLQTPGDWLIVYEHAEDILTALAFGKPWSSRFSTEEYPRILKETFGVTTVSDYDEFEIEI
jgi:hypothetical protein